MLRWFAGTAVHLSGGSAVELCAAGDGAHQHIQEAVVREGLSHSALCTALLGSVSVSHVHHITCMSCDCCMLVMCMCVYRE